LYLGKTNNHKGAAFAAPLEKGENRMKKILFTIMIVILVVSQSQLALAFYPNFQREKEEFIRIFFDDKEIKEIIDHDALKSIGDPGFIQGWCYEGKFIGLPDVKSRVISDEYGIAIEKSYSYRQFCVAASFLLRDLKPNEIRKLIVLLSTPYRKHAAKGDVEDFPPAIVPLFAFITKDKISDLTLLYLDLIWYPGMGIKNHHKTTKEYRDFYKYLFWGDKNSALKILRSPEIEKMFDKLFFKPKRNYYETIANHNNINFLCHAGFCDRYLC